MNIFAWFDNMRVGARLATIGDVSSFKQRYAINFRGSVHDGAAKPIRQALARPALPHQNANQDWESF